MSVTIRRGIYADAESIARIHVASWNETYRGVLSDAIIDVQTYERRVAEWSRILRDGDGIVYVAEVDGVPVGFASAMRNPIDDPPYDAFLDTLYVRKASQGRGVGRALLSAIARALVERGFRAMSLLTLRDRNPACEFYERIGAVAVREQPAPPVLGAGTVDRVYGFADLRALV